MQTSFKYIIQIYKDYLFLLLLQLKQKFKIQFLRILFANYVKEVPYIRKVEFYKLVKVNLIIVKVLKAEQYL